MKKIMLVAIVLLLTGCGKVGQEDVLETMTETKIATAATETVETAAETEPVGTEAPALQMLLNPQAHDFVRVADYIPEAQEELKYATADNFTGQVIYEFDEIFLRYGTVMKLKAVAEELAQQGIGIKIWDGFRPVSAQFKLWEIYPDPTFVADPNKGFSNHSRGFAVDLTLVDSDGRELDMPTDFDDFSARADRDYSECTDEQRENVLLLESVMEKHGFQGYWGEWWHFNDTVKYEVETCFDPCLITRRQTAGETPLLRDYQDAHSVILTIPEGEHVTILGYQEEYAMVEYWGYRGYAIHNGLSE